MNRAELVAEIAAQTGLSKSVTDRVLVAIFDKVSKTMCDGEPVRITGFGTFKAKPRRSAVRRNPHTGQRITVSAHAVPGFRPSLELKDMVRKRLKVVEASGKPALLKVR